MDKLAIKHLKERVEKNKLETAKLQVPTVLDMSEAITACDIQSKYRRKVRDTMRKRASTARARYPSSEKHISVRGITTDMKIFAEKSQVPKMSRFLEKAIKKRIGVPNLQILHKKALESIMSEVHQQFITITHHTGVIMKVKVPEEKKIKIEPHKYLGRTENYPNFLRTRRRLLTKYLLYLPLLRKILYECVTNLPHTLFDLTLLDSYPMSIADFKLKVQDQISEASQSFKDFYRKITVLVDDDSEPSCRTDLDLHRYYGACTGVMCIHLSRCIANTIESITEFSNPRNLIPYLTMKVSFVGEAVLTPNQEEIINLFTSFMNELLEVGNQFPVLQRVKLRGYESKRIFLCITKEFINKCIKNIKENIKVSYEPVLSFIGDLDTKYHDIYEDIALGGNEHFSDVRFEDGYAKIVFYKKFLFNIFHISSREYFSIGQVALTDYANSLTSGLKLIIDKIFQKLASQHEHEVSDINEAFELIDLRARKDTKTTEELVEIGRYMVWVREEFLAQLTERVECALMDLIKLITLGPLSQKHMYLNCAIKNWLDKLPPILEQYFSSYDQLKFEAEENLQGVIEEVTESVKKVYPLLDILNNMDDIASVKTYLKQINLHMLKIKEIEEKISWINQEEVCLSFPKSSYSEYENLKDFVHPFYHLLKLCSEVQSSIFVWEDGQLDFIRYDIVKSKLERYELELTDLQKTYRNKLRQAQEDSTAIKFKGTVDDPDILNWPAPLKLCGKALQLINNFKPAMKIIRIMCNPALEKRHWTEMSRIAEFDMQPNAGTTLKRLMSIDYGPNFDKYEAISRSATKEAELLTQLKKMEEMWSSIEFVIVIDEKIKCHILSGFEDIQEILDDNSIQISNMKQSVYVKPYKDKVDGFDNRIEIITSTLKESSSVQKVWLDFLPIFQEGNIAKKLTHIFELFFKVDSTYRSHVDRIHSRPNVMESVSDGNFLEELRHCKTNLEIIRHGLCEYIEVIQIYFPRFYFLSNDELIELLSKKDDMIEFEIFLNKLFPSISQLIYQNTKISGIRSEEREEMTFDIIDMNEAEGFVEVWLKRLEETIFSKVKTSILQSYEHHNTQSNLANWIESWPGHILLIALKVAWTAGIHRTLKTSKMEKILTRIEKDIDELSEIMKQQKQMNLLKLKVQPLIIDAIHRKNVTNKLIQKSIRNVDDFIWLSQVRYYLDKDICRVELLYASIAYGNEYINNSGRLVMTPLTERCYRTLFSAYHMHLYASPVGPAGTGKTETVKDLAKSLGILCIVFSCSDKLEFKTLIRFVKGIASCGCWLALDEFNRITTELLSVISQTICSLQLAVKTKCPTVIIENTQLKLNSACFMCITMNPGYPGRSILPENLKVLFRNVAMMIPDSTTIAEISLTSYGFENATDLSSKLVSALKFMAEMFSPAKHYDFGIRTLKSILSECEISVCGHHDIQEESIVVRSLRKVLVSRTLEEDRIIFDSILKDMFSSVVYSTSENVILKNVALKCCEENNIQLTEKLYNKICETWNSLQAHKGTIIVGNSDSGKTTVIKMLANILEEQDQSQVVKTKINSVIINPKSVKFTHLYGEYENSLDRWSDGIVTKYFRKWSEAANECNLGWIIFDGPIDSVWVENLNSVLDDNKKLCLSSGEVISANDFLTVIFEATDLKDASPATVSRCGVIFVEPSQESWKYIVQYWTNSYQEDWYKADSEYLKILLNWIIPGSLKIIRILKSLLSWQELVMVRTTVMLFQAYLEDALRTNCKKEEDSKNMRAWIQASLIQACVWGFLPGSSLELIMKFDELFRTLWKGQDVDYPYPQTIEKMDVGLPLDSIVYDSAYIYKQKGNWKNWSDLIKSEKISESLLSRDVLVPTIDTARYSSVLNMSIRNKIPVLFVGATGCGKTSVIRDFLLNKLGNSCFESSTLSLTFNITTDAVQERILAKLNKLKAGYYAPLEGKSHVLFIDDLHLPKRDQYGIQTVLELLRQHLDHNIWYDLNTLDNLQLARITLVAALTLDKFSSVSPRLLRHFSIFFLNEIPHEMCSKLHGGFMFNCWRQNGFPTDIISTVNQVTQATSEFYDEIKKKLKPSFENYLYQFTLFDYNRIIKGCMLLRKDTADADKKIFPKIWTHEVIRVFGDRIINPEHRALITQCLDHVVRETFHEELSQLFDNNQENQGELPTFRDLSQSFFMTNYEKECATYGEFTLSLLGETLTSLIAEYNEVHEVKIDVVLFEHAIGNVMKVAHVLSLPKRNALLIGTSGIGRKTASILATLLVKQKLFLPTVSEEYSEYGWRKEMKAAIVNAGARATQSVVLIDDSLFDRETLFDDIEFILKTDDLQTIFDSSEQQGILDDTRLRIQSEDISLDMNASTVFLYFNKCREENLHILLCASADRTLRSTLQRFPSVMKYCDKIALDTWPKEGFQFISDFWLRSVNLDEETKINVRNGFQFIHDYSEIISRKFYEELSFKNYVTTTSYLELVKTYSKIITEKQNDLSALKKRYDIGLDKLSFAALQIAKMQQRLSEYQPQLEDMTRKAKEMTEQIATETTEVEKVSALVRIDEKIANEQAIAASFLKVDCEADLAQAIPILEDAISALNTLKPTDITLVKSMKNPPDAIKLVMAAVCVIKDVRPDRIPDPSTGRKIIDYWGPSKRILGDMNFLQTLKDFDKDHIKPEIMTKIRKEYLPHKDFAPHIVAKASSAAEGLCKWIIAMDMYDKVAKEVAPKKEKLEKAEMEYAQTLAILNEKKSEVARIEEKLATLNSLLEEARKKQQVLQREVDLCSRRLQKAQRLIDGLGGEKERWTSISDKLQRHIDELAGDILVSSGMIAYLAPFPNEYRKNAINNWHNFIRTNSIPCSDEFDFTQILGSEAVVQEWHINDLPLDDFFVESAIIHLQTNRWPLFLDPQFLAKNWIQQTERNNELSVIKISDKCLIQSIRVHMKSGKPVLLEGIRNQIPTSLEPILLKKIIKRDEIYYLNLYGVEEEYNPNFRLYLTCFTKTPQLDPPIFTRLCVINFGLTVTSLTKILLNSVIRMENPIKRQAEDSLNMKLFENGRQLKAVEEKILQTLSESKSDILEDEKALKILDESKDISNRIRQQQKTVNSELKKINDFKQAYSKIAEQTAVVFDVLSELYKINMMYQYSLDWFLDIITQSIQTAEKSKVMTKRIDILKEKITQDIFLNISKSLYIEDRMVFAFHLCVKLEMFHSRVTAKEIIFLTEITQVTTGTSDIDCAWVPESCKIRISKLIEFDDSYEVLCQSIEENVSLYRNFLVDSGVDNFTLPFSWYQEFSNFSKLLLHSTLRPDKIPVLITHYITEVLGKKYIEPIRFDISLTFNQSSALCPLIFLMTIDTDPVNILLQFAKLKNMLHKLHTISLGECLKNRVIDLITRGQREGLWICLENCHLAPSWMSLLEVIFVEMTYENTHENFRLWLTTSESADFPVFLLQNSIKIVTQSPPGIKHNMLRTYMQHPVNDSEFFQGCPRRSESFVRLLYSLALFHSVIVERKKFGPIGWNIPYEFKQIDFSLAAKHLQIFLNQYDDPFESLLYVIGECDYGGRVSDDWDQNLFNIILKDFLNGSILNGSVNILKNDLYKYYGLPKKNDYQDYIKVIRELPDYDPPELFGLHNNMEQIRSTNFSNVFLKKVTQIMNTNRNSIHFTSNYVEHVVRDVLSRLPEFPNAKFTVENLQKRILFREVKCYEALYNEIYSSLQDTIRAVTGEITLSNRLQNIIGALLEYKIPNSWIKFSYPTIYSLGRYITDLKKRLEHLSNWSMDCDFRYIWFPLLIHPNAFLAVVKQHYSHKTGNSLEKVEFSYDVGTPSTCNEDNVRISGLFMEGARWNSEENRIDELLPRMLYDKMPEITITSPIEQIRDRKCKVPVYRTSARRGVISTSGHSSNYIFAVFLNSDQHYTHWMKRSVALVCQVQEDYD